MPKYPEINIPLVGQGGNAFAILGRCSGAMRRARVPAEQQEQFFAEAESGDYNHLLCTVMDWFSTDEDV